MATNFPTSLDALTNPTGSSSLTSPDHAGQHTDANDAIEALQAKVGVNGSAITTSLDYKVTVLSPSGLVSMFAGSTAPTGWLICDGTAISRSTYAELFAAIGVTYGAGNGSTTFNLPNLKGRVPVGRDAAQTEFDALGETGGASSHTLSSAEMPSHTHTQNAHTHTQDSHNHTQNAHNHGITDPGHIHSLNQWAFFVQTALVSGFNTSSNTGVLPSTVNTNSNTTGISINNATATNQATTATNQNTTATNQNTGGGQPHNNLQPYIVVNYIIKT